jgi:hypothetical protein
MPKVLARFGAECLHAHWHGDRDPVRPEGDVHDIYLLPFSCTESDFCLDPTGWTHLLRAIIVGICTYQMILGCTIVASGAEGWLLLSALVGWEPKVTC